VLHGCSGGCEIQRLPGNRAVIWITGFSITISITIFVSRSNTLIVVQEHDMLEKFLTRMRHSTKKRGSTRLRTTKAAKVTPRLTVTGQPKAALHAGQRIRERTLCLAAKVEDTPWGFVGDTQKKISWRINCGWN
jgi:hypothetical protein